MSTSWHCHTNWLEYSNTFWVGPYETVLEVEPNSDFSSPQVIAINRTVEGRVDNEDVDYYAVEAKKGQRLSVEVEGIRLEVRITLSLILTLPF